MLWGLYWGALILLEKLFISKMLSKLPSFVSHIWCILLFFYGWLLFSVTGLHQVVDWTAGMFGAYGLTGTSTLWELQSWSYISLIPIMIIGSLPWAPYLRKRIEAWIKGESGKGIVAAPQKGNNFVPPCILNTEGAINEGRVRVANCVNIVVDIALLMIFILSCMSVVSSSYNPFIYFQF